MRETNRPLQELYKRCVLAHNFLFDESGYSTIGALIECLDLENKFTLKSPEHLFLGAYAFWGAEKVGGSRAGFGRRLQRFGEDHIWTIHQRIRLSARFGAWELVEHDQKSSRWSLLGPSPQNEVRTAQFVTDSGGDLDLPTTHRFRAGWSIKIGSVEALVFSLPIAPPGVEKLQAALAKDGWTEPSTGKPITEEYERDVLIQAILPGSEECGLHEYYFLPPHLRGLFPTRFQNACPQEAGRYIRTTWGDFWHLYLAMQTGEERPEELRRAFVQIRQRATRSAFYYSDFSSVSRDLLEKLVSDEELFQMLGLTPQGKVSLDLFSPILAHPLEVLELEDSFFEATGLTAQTSIQKAQRTLEETHPWREQLELAIIAHRRRLGWASLIWRAREAGVDVELGYSELRLVADRLFGPALLTRPLEEIIDRRAAGRIARAMADELSEPTVRVLHLPEHHYELATYPGIGPGTLKATAEGLEHAMLGFAERFLANSTLDEAQHEIDAGLDELAALFD